MALGLFKMQATSKKKICLVLSICFIGLILPADAKKLLYQLPKADKMTEGDSPTSDTEQQAKNVNLAPIGIGGDEANVVGEQDDNGLLKSTVSQTDFKAKEANAAASGKNEVVVGKSLGDKINKGKKAPNPGPLPINDVNLVQSEEEAAAVADTVMDAEKRQLSELWSCTIDRNPDIQFVIQKLQPSSDANHAMAATMKVLSSTLFGAMNMAPMLMPGGISGANPAALMGMQGGAGLIQGLYQDKAMKGAKKMAVSQEQATILYKIVRETADKLVAAYREYKKEQAAVLRTTTDLADLQTMAAEAHAKSPAAQVELEYTLRKAKRDIDEKLEQAKLYHQQLTDLAGSEAVAKLDLELEQERNAIADLAGKSSPEQNKNDGPFKNPLVGGNERSQDKVH